MLQQPGLQLSNIPMVKGFFYCPDTFVYSLTLHQFPGTTDIGIYRRDAVVVNLSTSRNINSERFAGPNFCFTRTAQVHRHIFGSQICCSCGS